MRAPYLCRFIPACAAIFFATAVGMADDVRLAAPIQLRLDGDFAEPMGFHDATPHFSWQLPPDVGVQRQTAYRLVVASAPDLLPDRADLWDSGKITTDQSIWVPYAGRKLDSRKKAWWRVQFWDEQGRASAWSESATFELGLLHNSDWQAQWIQLDGPKVFTPPVQWIEADRATPRKGVDIEIISARYGDSAAPEKSIDVAPAIRAQIAQGNFLLEVSDALAGGQTLPTGKRRLKLHYRITNKEVNRTFAPGTTFDLFGRRDYVTLVPEYLRKEFTLPSPIQKARLYVSARGLYEIFLNGSRVGEDCLAPGWTTYRSWIESLTYDVTAQLQQGKNALAATLAEGWYAGRIGAAGAYTNTHPELICQLEITLADGRQVVISTDRTWKASNRGPIRLASIFDGEVYDARQEMPGWNRPGFDDAHWSGVKTSALDPAIALTPKEHFPVRVQHTLPTQKITEPQPGRFVFDLGQNIVGWPELTLPVKAGQTVTVRFAEMLQADGTLYTENYRTARSTDYYTAAHDGTVTWRPVFTFHGFRYVELSGLPAGTAPSPDWVKGLALNSAFEPIGQFTSSDAKLNRLQENILWGQRGNFLDIPTDCPQRDERQGWTGDAQVFCPTSQFNYNTRAFWSSWARSLRANQRTDGIIPWVVPSAQDAPKQFGSPGWGDVAVTIPWDVYVRSGDRTILEKNYAMMEKWLAAYTADAKDFIVHRDGFGDWLQPYSKGNLQVKRGALVGETALELIATAYYGRCTAIMEQVATLLGKPDAAARYRAQFANIRRAFSRAFFDPNGRLTTAFETQTGYLMGLGYDLLEPELREPAAKNLLREIDEAGGHLRTGFLGTPLLAFVLDHTGYPEIAYQVLFKETYPSWFYSINQGATTMWERWNSYSHEHGFGDATMNSFNHYAYGAIGQWMYERIAGLAPDPTRPGYKHFFIQPQPGGPLTSARAELATPYGRAVSGWQRAGRILTINAVVPPNTTATLIVPTQGDATPKLTLSGQPCQLVQQGGRFIHELKPGSYTFALNWD